MPLWKNVMWDCLLLLLCGNGVLFAEESDYVKAVRESTEVIDIRLDGKTLTRKVAYRWANPSTKQQVGQFVLYFAADSKRPVATVKNAPTIARFKGRPKFKDLRVDHVVVTLTPEPLICTHDGSVLWTSPPSDLHFIRLEDVPPPHDAKSRRPSQAKVIARGFSAEIDAPGAKHFNASRTLRLLPTPVHRYGTQGLGEDGLMDGYVFLFVLEGGSPPICLLLEAIRKDGELFWQYGISRRGVDKLAVKLKDSYVWEVARIPDSSTEQVLYRIRDPRGSDQLR